MVMGVMSILAYLVFSIAGATMNSLKDRNAGIMVGLIKTSLEKIGKITITESREQFIEEGAHPLYRLVWKPNTIVTFRDEDVVANNITANGYYDLINKGDFSIKADYFGSDAVRYGNTTEMTTIVDGWGRPICGMRNAITWHEGRMKKNEDIIQDLYKNREKSTVSLYMDYMFRNNKSGENLYEWNDSSFQNGYEIAPLDGDKDIREAVIYGMVALPYIKNGFDLFSAGKDGKISNLIKGDHFADSWNDTVDEERKWIGVAGEDYDDDNITTFAEITSGRRP
ncbi:MAG: hypothetical protein COA79_03120 [Planctomycetota bacterium]|nr:MAG: hypothetical protein COA79_03120 [Planctomycetota bacterium]